MLVGGVADVFEFAASEWVRRETCAQSQFCWRGWWSARKIIVVWCECAIFARAWNDIAFFTISVSEAPSMGPPIPR